PRAAPPVRRSVRPDAFALRGRIRIRAAGPVLAARTLRYPAGAGLGRTPQILAHSQARRPPLASRRRNRGFDRLAGELRDPVGRPEDRGNPYGLRGPDDHTRDPVRPGVAHRPDQPSLQEGRLGRWLQRQWLRWRLWRPRLRRRLRRWLRRRVRGVIG